MSIRTQHSFIFDLTAILSLGRITTVRHYIHHRSLGTNLKSRPFPLSHSLLLPPSPPRNPVLPYFHHYPHALTAAGNDISDDGMSGSDPGSLASDTSERVQDAHHHSDLGSPDSDISDLLEDDLPPLLVADTACASGTNDGDIATAACAVRKGEE